ncbi:DUF2336 domain-containing protein [Roseibium litorale]|uniref:DUF2336 domain-containing protein n=1 Tax=Roseibium litorale TaxID=2803841 RepID=A0ABR9CRM1_9HYPH|nr:DUF2336 domain-containing protein [Roseibium litorale]
MLRSATDLYVSRQSHDPHEKALYRELAVSSLDRVSTEDRRQIAFQLVRHPDAPQDVLARLAVDEDATTAYPVLRNALHVDHDILLKQAVGGPDSLRRAILGRTDVTLEILDAIAEHGGVDAVRELLHHPDFILDEETVHLLCTRHEILPAIGSQLAARGVLTSRQMMGSFLSLASDLRMEALASAELTALVALARNGGRKPPRPQIRQEVLIELEKTALSGTPEAFSNRLSDATGLALAATSKIAGDNSGEALAVCLKALGIPQISAERMFVRLLGKHLGFLEIRGLSALYDSLSEGAAVALVNQWRAAEEPGARKAGPHQSQYQETKPARGSRPVTGDTIWQDLDDIERLLRIG